MTTYTSEPGTRLGGRYRLEDRIAAGSGWAAWKAIDETLARAVTVFTFAQGFPRVSEVATAARAASRLTDPRLAQVFDVEDSWDRAYIVMEWAAGETLGDMLSHGALDPLRAARMIAEAASALSSAHAAGVAHMCLSPGSVRWSQTGEVKVVGLGIDAALAGVSADDPVAADTVGLGRLLYAALTGYWPGPDHYPALPPAPLMDGGPCSPRQVVAGVPPALSDLTCRAMRLLSRDSALPPVAAPDELARALLAALPPAPLPPAPAAPAWQSESPRRAGASRRRGGRDTQRQDAQETSWPGRPGSVSAAGADYALEAAGGHDAVGQPAAPYGTRSPTSPARSWRDLIVRRGREAGESTGSLGHRRRTSAGPGGPGGFSSLPGGLPVGLAAGIGALALVAVAAFAFWPGSGGAPIDRTASHRSTPAASASILRPVRASGFDPLTSPQRDHSDENTQWASYAIDASARTAWTSQWYTTAEFGGLKSGSGLIIDMGKQVRFQSVTVRFGPVPGGDVKLLVGNSASRSRANLDTMTTVASATSPTGQHTFSINSAVSGRYLVIWFTKLPRKPQSRGKFMAEVFNVAIKGVS